MDNVKLLYVLDVQLQTEGDRLRHREAVGRRTVDTLFRVCATSGCATPSCQVVALDIEAQGVHLEFPCPFARQRITQGYVTQTGEGVVEDILRGVGTHVATINGRDTREFSRGILRSPSLQHIRVHAVAGTI